MRAECGHAVGQWCWHTRHATPCRVVERLMLWGVEVYRVWLPGQNAVLRTHAPELTALDTLHLGAAQILHAAAAAKLCHVLDGAWREDTLLLAPIQSSVTPLPHQLTALNRVMRSVMHNGRIRYLLADEVGLGKTIEAGLILRELKLRGRAKRILVVAPKGLVRQWQAEIRQHFGEALPFVEPAALAARHPQHGEHAENSTADNPWRMHDQVICALDSVKPMAARRGWSTQQVQSYNRTRFEDLVAAAWDLVIIDEAHRLGGSTEQVARYKLGAALAEAAPYLLLLSATPHQGKTEQFMRLMQLLDRDTFPDEGSVSRERVQPFVIRTEKRAAIDTEGQALFRPRLTRLHAVAWQTHHAGQRQLYEAVTDYVRHGYNQALATQQRHIGFLMILMQRLVTSSTAAIRATLEKRLAVLDAPQTQTGLFDTLSTDAKAENLLALIYQLQQEESNPALKVLVFTEFVPTQAMLADFLANRGVAVAVLNGCMDMQARTQAVQHFAQAVRVLISTDAGGEGLNLQFCHIIVNFDMPWNPMRIEQRIGRVDRIGQKHVVRAFNFVLQDTVEHRVRQVLEENQHRDLLTVADTLEPAEARRWRDHPAQFWLERAIVNGLPARGGCATKTASLWHLRWPDGSETPQACFDAHTASEHPAAQWLTLEDPRARALIADVPHFVAGQPMPLVCVAGLPESVSGIWSLWEIALMAEGVHRRYFLPVFATLRDAHRDYLKEERDRALYAFGLRTQAIARIGLPAVRAFRHRRLQTEHQTRLAALDTMQACTPELSAVVVLRIDDDKSEHNNTSGRNA